MEDVTVMNGSLRLDETAEIISAYVANNRVAPDELPALIASIHDVLAKVASGPSVAAEVSATKATPAQIRKSIGPDALISFLDGKPYKTLRRHLTTNGLDENAYRDRFGLPRDYPMTAAAYSAHRSEIAKTLGLGGRPGRRTKAVDVSETVAKAPAKASKAARSPKASKADLAEKAAEPAPAE